MTWGVKTSEKEAEAKQQEVNEQNDAPTLEQGIVKTCGEERHCERKYRTCCCHVKSVSYVLTIIEVVVLLIVIVIMVSALSRGCWRYRRGDPEGKTNGTGQMAQENHHKDGHDRDHNNGDRDRDNGDRDRDSDHGKKDKEGHKKRWHQKDSRRVYLLGRSIHKRKLVALLIWTSVIAVCASSMLYGIQHHKWGFMIPHLIFHGLAIMYHAICTMVAFFILAGGIENEEWGAKLKACRACRIWSPLQTVVGIYLFWVFVRCCQYVKAVPKENQMRDSDSMPVYIITPTAGTDQIAQPEGELEAPPAYEEKEKKYEE